MSFNWFIADRNEALFSPDEEKIKRFPRKYRCPIPADKRVFWAGVYKAILHIAESPAELKAKAAKWLDDNGFTKEI